MVDGEWTEISRQVLNFAAAQSRLAGSELGDCH